MKNATDLAIVGAGIAELAAGCYAQINGYRSIIGNIKFLVLIKISPIAFLDRSVR